MIPARLFVLLLLPCLALPAPARATPIRALEHPEFSRILLPVPPLVDWRLQRTQRSARLVLSGPVPALDLSGIFDRMPRSRIRSVSASPRSDGATLTLELGCDCEMVIERLGEMLLAVDVRSPGSAPPPAIPERAPLGQEVRPQAAAGAVPPLDAPPTPETRTGAEPVSAPHRAPGAPAGGGRPDGAKFISASPRSDKPDASLPAADDPVRMARDALVRQLERAAAAGLVELAPDAADAARALTASRPEAAPQQEPLPDVALLPRLTRAAPADAGDIPAAGTRQAPPRPEAPEPQDAQAETPETSDGPKLAAPSADAAPDGAGQLAHLHARAPLEEPTVQAPQADRCFEDTLLDVSLWPQAGGDLTAALGKGRRALYTEAGELDTEAVRDLARLYITVGFGREAARLLDSAGLAERPEPLHDLSMLVEGRPPAPDGAILAAAGCAGRVVMWRAVAGAESLDSDAPAWPAIRAGLMELPPRLRRVVGQELARQALLGDGPDAAREVIDLLDRTPGGAPQMETRVRAALAIARGEPDLALALIAPEIEGPASPDPEALLLHARATLAGGTSPDPAVMTMLDAAIPGYDVAAPVGRALRLVRAELEAASGRPSQALDIVQRVLEASGGANPDALTTGRQILADIPAEARSGLLGARVILAHRNLLDNGAESRTLRLDYAAALIEGGLPNAALKLLDTPRVLEDRETRLVAARAHLSLGADDAVFRMLEGMQDGAAARLRSAVFWRRGDMGAAHAALAGLAATDAGRNAAALLSGKWDALDPEAVAEPYAQLATYAVEQADRRGGARKLTSEAAESLPTLAEAQAALAEARRLREAFGVGGPEG